MKVRLHAGCRIPAPIRRAMPNTTTLVCARRAASASLVMTPESALRNTALNAQHREKLERTIANSLVHTLSQEHMSVASDVVPWYLRSFPASYFNNVGESTRMAHLKGLAALAGIHQQSNDTDISLTLTSKADDPTLTDVTVIATDCSPGMLNRRLKNLHAPFESGEIRRAQLYMSSDDMISLTVFTYGACGEEPVWATMEDAQPLLAQVTASQESHAAVSEENIADFVKECGSNYFRNLTPVRFLTERKLYESVRGTEGVDVSFLQYEGSHAENSAWVTMAAANVLPEVMLKKVTALFAARGLSVRRMSLDLMRDDLGSTG